MLRLFLLVAVVACVLSQVVSALAEAPSIYYVYDALNRLTAVVDQQGRAATYTYDAVGNILKIDRVEPPAGLVVISLFTPTLGPPGTTVHIFGRGFGSTAAQNAVAFNGVAAMITAAAGNRLIAAVPPHATTGPIRVTTPLGSATSALDFRVLGSLTISPPALTIPLGATRGFTATEGGLPAARVRWLVNGIPGGESSTGTISSAGVYTAPSTLPFPTSVTVAARHTDDAGLAASAPVTIVPPLPLFLASRGVAVAVTSPALDRSVTASVSVGIVAAIPQTVAVGQPVSVSLAPVVTAVAPAGAPAGSVGLELTITGAGLTDASAISFHRDGVTDPALTATNLFVNAEGTEAIVEVSVAPDAAGGLRVVRVTTPVGMSTAAGTHGNLFSIP